MKFEPIPEKLEKWIRSIPEGERAKLKAPLMRLRNVARTAQQILFWSKIAPEIQKEDSPVFAKWSSQDLKAHKRVILKAAEKNDKQFFIDLGKCLSGEMSSALCDDSDEDVAILLAGAALIPAKDAVRFLKGCGWSISEEAFRVRKQRLKRALGEFGLEIVAQKESDKENVRHR